MIYDNYRKFFLDKFLKNFYDLICFYIRLFLYLCDVNPFLTRKRIFCYRGVGLEGINYDLVCLVNDRGID